MIRQIFTVLLLSSAALLWSPQTHAEVSKASDWVGRVVVTPGGELLGRIEDLALEDERIAFYVVSIGSFLIDDNLIAVHPEALGASSDGRYLVVYSDDLGSARRFGKANWPNSPDVLPSAERVAVTVDESVTAEDDDSGFESDRIATISDGRRTATLKSGERAVIETEGPEETESVEIGVQPKTYRGATEGDPIVADSEFERLDDDGDGYLSRREIGPRLRRDVRYQDYDLDGNDGLDPFEYQVLKDDA